MKYTILSVAVALFFLLNHSTAQTVITNSAIQDSLGKYSSRIWKQKTDSSRLAASEVFFDQFHAILTQDYTVKLPLDSISGITRVASSDNKMRVFTWNVPLSDGTNKYYGFIQMITDSISVYPLKAYKIVEGDFTDEVFTTLTWYGAIYYKLIERESSGEKIYTLLGWDGYNSAATRKIIDIMSIDKQGIITFGKPVFKTPQGTKSRICIEYADKANVLLRYDYQAINVQKRKRIKKMYEWMIVMDRLVPMDPSLKGMPKFYVPSGDTYDGYVFRDGYWSFVEDLEVANKSIEKK